jgi:hypothetical protein
MWAGGPDFVLDVAFVLPAWMYNIWNKLYTLWVIVARGLSAGGGTKRRMM